MGKHSRCVIDMCDNDMQYPVQHKNTVMWMEISSGTNYQKMEL